MQGTIWRLSPHIPRLSNMTRTRKANICFFRGRDLHVVSTVNYLTSTTQILSIQVTYMFRSRKSADYEKYRLYQSNCFLKEDSKIFKILIMNWFHSTTWQWFSLWMYYLSKYVWNEKFPMNFHLLNKS